MHPWFSDVTPRYLFWSNPSLCPSLRRVQCTVLYALLKSIISFVSHIFSAMYNAVCVTLFNKGYTTSGWCATTHTCHKFARNWWYRCSMCLKACAVCARGRDSWFVWLSDEAYMPFHPLDLLLALLKYVSHHTTGYTLQKWKVVAQCQRLKHYK